MRTSTIALSTLAALIAQELAGTAGVNPSTVTSNSPTSLPGATQPDQALGDLGTTAPIPPISQPETTQLPRVGNPRLKTEAAPKLATGTVGRSLNNPNALAQLLGLNPSVVSWNSALLPVPALPSGLGGSPLGLPRAPLPIDDIIKVSLNSRPESPIIPPAEPTLVTTGSTDARTQRVSGQQSSVKLAAERNIPAQRSEVKPAIASPKAAITDIQGHWAQEFIEALATRGVVRGFSDGSFRPDQGVTPAEFAQIMQQVQGTTRSQSSQPTRMPGMVKTRADAAVYAYQTLVREGKVPRLMAGNSASSPSQAAPPVAAPSTSPVATLVSAAINSDASTPFPPDPQAAISAPERMGTEGSIPNNRIGVSAINPDRLSSGTLTPASTAQQDDYTLGAGDHLRMDVFGVPEYSGDYPVLVNGTVNLPLIGGVSVNGMTLAQAGETISNRYKPLVKRAIATVSLVTPRPLNVAIAGEVNRPGSYAMSLTDGKFPTLTKAIQLAGGLTQAANLRQVQVRRPQRSGVDQVITLDLWELLQSGNLQQDLTLRDGDTVLIPASSTVNLADASQLAASNVATDPAQPISVAVVGEVFRPGPYAIARGEKASGLPTVTQAIQQAGGITQSADLRQIQVKRSTRNGVGQTITVNLWQLLQTGDLQQDLALQQGDTILIPAATALNPAEANQLGSASFSPKVVKVNVVGEVTRPGAIDVPPNTPLNQALLAAGGFTNRARKNSVELIRLNPNGTVTRQNISIDFGAGINDKTNPMLRNNDIITVGRSGTAKFSDTLDSVLSPLGRLLPFVFLF